MGDPSKEKTRKISIDIFLDFSHCLFSSFSQYVFIKHIIYSLLKTKQKHFLQSPLSLFFSITLISTFANLTHIHNISLLLYSSPSLALSSLIIIQPSSFHNLHHHPHRLPSRTNNTPLQQLFLLQQQLHHYKIKHHFYLLDFYNNG